MQPYEYTGRLKLMLLRAVPGTHLVLWYPAFSAKLELFEAAVEDFTLVEKIQVGYYYVRFRATLICHGISEVDQGCGILNIFRTDGTLARV